MNINHDSKAFSLNYIFTSGIELGMKHSFQTLRHFECRTTDCLPKPKEVSAPDIFHSQGRSP